VQTSSSVSTSSFWATALNKSVKWSSSQNITGCCQVLHVENQFWGSSFPSVGTLFSKINDPECRILAGYWTVILPYCHDGIT